MRKLLRWLFRALFGVVFVVVAVLGVVIFFQIPLDLTQFKAPVEAIVSKGLNRSVRIDKSIVIATSLKPYFTIEGLVIENSEGFKTDYFLSMDLAKIQIELMPLLKKKVHITEIRVQGLHVSLEESEAGNNNWVFGVKDVTTTEPFAKTGGKVEISAPKRGENLASDSLVVRKLDLQDIEVSFLRASDEKPSHFQLKTCLGTMLPNEPLSLDIEGNVIDFDYSVAVSIASLNEFITERKSWVDIKAAIAETEMAFSGNVDLTTATKSLVLQTMVQGENLKSLNDLLQLDLPPFAMYKVETILHLQPKEIEMQKLVVKAGTSSLEGTAQVALAEEVTTIDLKLIAPLVQLDDFLFDDWSWSNDDVAKTEDIEGDTPNPEETAVAEDVTDDTATGRQNKRLADPEVLAKFDCFLSIDSEKVVSGDDLLGSGQLKASLQEGRLKIDPLTIKLPGGSIGLVASLKPGTEKSDAELKVKIENFDIGIWVRRSKPESDMGGLVNLDMDVTSSASSMAELLENGNGYFDFSGDLQNFGAGIIDLWAVNLVAAIVSGADKSKSELNCALGRWSVADGILEPVAFFIDTSKIRICADGMVDLKEKQFQIKVRPQAKKAQFFSLATPLEIQGAFTDINVGIGQGGILSTALNFIVSPLSVPLQRAFMGKVPADGSDICGMALGPDNRKDVVVPMCSVQ